MEYVTYIIVALIPALAILYTVRSFLKKHNEKDIIRLEATLRTERQKFFLEPRSDAYQRVVLFLERITPHNLIMRLHNNNKGATLFQTELLNNIRSEYDHNVAQQLFISPSAWDLVKKSKEETIKIINVAAQQLEDDATAIDLSRKIFEIVAEVGELPTEIAINAIKKEFQSLF
ncbi:MAG TPA: hypothetical protein VL021_09900 [Brumimicrobium sp.]|nr:hypothetical protein [Brumimicrobium sp.]